MESVTGLSEAAWLVGEDCDEVALSPLPPQATSSSAGTSASITYDAARGVEIRFVMEDSCMGCARGAVSRTDCLQSVLQCTAAAHIKVLPLDSAGELQPTDPTFGSGVVPIGRASCRDSVGQYV